MGTECALTWNYEIGPTEIIGKLMPIILSRLFSDVVDAE